MNTKSSCLRPLHLPQQRFRHPHVLRHPDLPVHGNGLRQKLAGLLAVAGGLRSRSIQAYQRRVRDGEPVLIYVMGSVGKLQRAQGWPEGNKESGRLIGSLRHS